jgi:predicted Rossmann fold flavoprotein
MKIGIIGGGPSGMFAAIEASKKYSDITIFDKNEFPGRKLSATGAGRCNLTNVYVTSARYRSTHDNSFRKLIDQYDYNFLNEYFRRLGIYTYHTDDGWVYPLSNSARNISLFLENLLSQLNVNIQKNTSVISINKNDNRFQLLTDTGKTSQFDRLIIASGGKAYPQLNASDEIIQSLEKFGHTQIPAFPALSPIVTSKTETKSLNGVRLDATICILRNNIEIGSEFGNIIFTEWGLNGPGVMNLSHLVRNHRDLTIEIDLASVLPETFINTTLANKENFLLLATPLLPIVNKKIIDQFLRNSKFKLDSLFRSDDFIQLIKNLKFKEKILGTRDFEFAQVSTGAIESSNINPETLESRLVPGLYFAGEVLDMFGPCGGYNLHWAFISGIVSGKLIN